MNVVLSNNNDIETRILSNSSLGGSTGNNHANKTSYLCDRSEELVANYPFTVVSFSFLMPMTIIIVFNN